VNESAESFPGLDQFNGALDYFDVLAAGNSEVALWIVDDNGTNTKRKFADLLGDEFAANEMTHLRPVRAHAIDNVGGCCRKRAESCFAFPEGALMPAFNKICGHSGQKTRYPKSRSLGRWRPRK
jgi:hypothetical protein